jgi:hypothetical protein
MSTLAPQAAGDIMTTATSVARFFTRGLIALAAVGGVGTAAAHDQVAGAVLGAGAGAIIGHSIGGPEAAMVGGIVGAAAGAAITSHRGPGMEVHYRGGHRGYVPPRVYHPAPRGPVYVMPPPPVVFVPSRGHGYWQHEIDPWGRPVRQWVPAPRYYAPPPVYYHPHRSPRW